MDDLLRLAEQLSAEEQLIRDNVRHMVEREVMPHIIDAYEGAYFPNDFIKHAANLGLLGITLPEQYGGAGANYVSYGLVCQELERGDSGLRSFVSVQNSLCMYPIFRFGTEEQKTTYLPQMAKAEIIACFGLSEPNAGSDPSSMSTVAKKVSGGWQLSGSKMWITNGPIADIAIIWAKADDTIKGFIVDCKAKGFSCQEITHKLSLRASTTGELAFDNVFIPDDHVLEGATRGLADALTCLTQARYGIAWGAMGAAEACFDIALDYCQERKQFDKPLAGFQLVQADLAQMYTELVKSRCMNLHIGRLRDKGDNNPIIVSLAKRNACREALKIARSARNLLGGNGITLDYHVMRHAANLETVFTYEGTDNIHTLVLGRHLTGINAFD